MIFLETERLLFRPHRREDEPAFIRMHTDPRVRRYAGGPAWSGEIALQRFQTEYLGKPYKTYGLWAAVLKMESKGKENEEEKFIGSAGLRFVRAGEASLGLYFAPFYWGRGFGTEAGRAFVDLAFDRLELSRVVADVEKGHTASERVLQKVGFAKVREEVIPGGSRIICHYELPLKALKEEKHMPIPMRRART
jgi:RimJ/RimL family protein N-acetyltransferase